MTDEYQLILPFQTLEDADAPNCLVGDVETSLGEQILPIPVARREAGVEPDGVLNAGSRKSVAALGNLDHPPKLQPLST